MTKTAARVLVLALGAASVGGCSAIGGLSQGVGSLFSLAIALAAIAAPIALTYWLYTKDHK